MGSAHSTPPVTPPFTPPEVASPRGRTDFLNKLGIQKTHTVGSFVNVPTSCQPLEREDSKHKKCKQIHEASDQLEQVPSGDSPNTGELLSELDGGGSNFLDLRRQEDFRVSFLRKLSYENVWVPVVRRSPQSQTVIIFDWDDTLLCTSFLNASYDKPMSVNAKRHLKGIEQAALQLLELAMSLGEVFIITNAMEGWVEWSAEKYVPALLPILDRLRIISARTKFEAEYPMDYGQWKIQAFLEVQRQLNSPVVTNLICLGDSQFEMDAVKVMGAEFAEAVVKTVKFRESPGPQELLKQIDLVRSKFKRIVENAGHLKIGLESKHRPSPTSRDSHWQ